MSLTASQIKDAFALFDIDGSGSLGRDEALLVFKGLGISDVSPSQLNLSLGANGRITFANFHSLVQQSLAAQTVGDELWKSFRAFDRDQKGRISFADLTVVAASMSPPLPAATLKQILECGEYPQKGLSFDEWKFMLQTVRTQNKNRRVTKL